MSILILALTQHQQPKLSMLSKLRQGAKRIDMFSTTQFLRYREETEYATLSGACLSVGIVAVILLLVYQVLLHTVNKDEVTWSMTTSKEIVPTDLDLQVEEMKLGIYIIGVDLNDPTVSYFDVVAESYTVVGSTVVSSNRMALSACDLQDWSQTQEMAEVYTRNKGSQWLCPDPTANFTLGGRWTAQDAEMVRIILYPCGSVYTAKTNCATDLQMTSLFLSLDGSISMMLMMDNALIQPDEISPVSEYVEDTYFVTFNPAFGQTLLVEVSDYLIQTDHSLLPLTSIETNTGAILSEKTTSFITSRTDNDSQYAAFRLQKSASKLEYKRSFNKLDETVSYAGGLIGVVVGLFFVMAPYTQLCFELSLANRLFADEEGRPLRTSMNFLKFMVYCLFTLLNMCHECVSWPQYALYTRSSQQVQKQLDVSYLLRRINSLERIITRDKAWSAQIEEGFRSMSFEESEDKEQRMNKPPSEDEGLCSGEKHMAEVNECSIVELGKANDLPFEGANNSVEIQSAIVRPVSRSERSEEPFESKRIITRRDKRKRQNGHQQLLANPRRKDNEVEISVQELSS